MSQDTPNSSRQPSQSPSQTLPPQWQQPPSQPLPYSPYAQPPPPYPYQQPVRQAEQPPMPPAPAPKKKSHKKLWIGLIVAVIVLVIIISAMNHGGSPTPTPTKQATPVPTQQSQNTPAPPTSTPQPTPHGGIGVTNTVGTWMVTLNKASTSPGTEFDTPKAGDVYIVVDVTAENTSGTSQLLSSEGNFVFQDTSGQAYTETFTSIGVPPDGTIPAGGKLRGQLVYEIPKSLHNFTLMFQDSMFNGNSATWTLTV